MDGDDCVADIAMNKKWQWKPKYSEKTCPNAAFSTSAPT
jgi:hypothetical protein